ncbi:carbonic anhydrase [Nissabacter sp. SGAir0207]|uniref:carbonic anhydrase n=1 Tax=Nissabacter sp. SGAir0207 TaxID=2126321 RepID=UPI00197F9D4F|nr:carbonic anhydrase family protein [Nissabacter sp. SGAir0207]
MKHALFLAASLLATLPAVAADHTASSAPHWGYEGEGAPAHWGTLSQDFSLCEYGKNQSPIDIHDALKAHPRPLKVSYPKAPESMVNNGHTLQISVPEGNKVTLDGEAFRLQQFHFHAPSENTLNGESFPMEMHLVHKDADGEMAVVAVMFKLGKANPVLEALWQQMPQQVDQPVALTKALDLNGLLPHSLTHYRFSGSLTTPPCSEGVRWLVLKQPQTLSEAQLEKFKQLMHHNNNRPVQPLHGRVVVE